MKKQYDDVNAMIAAGKIKSMSIEATVIRANGDIEPQGTIAGYDRNILKNIILWMKIKRDRIRVRMSNK
jgi:hypothetical protein